ncbi:MAG: hypothetical protein DMD48_06155 [Gemmatimonadetes bacterium]|nr:MAG: hypothetical protein DMD48_06155 [Gemmatimonadota bacterium]
MTLIYLLLFAAPQLLLYLYLRERLPLTARRPLALLFVVFNIPWVIVAVRMFSGSLWGISRTPYIAPWIAWQLLGWIFCGLVAVYILGKAVRRLGGWAVSKLRASPTAQPPNRPTALSRRQFLARATYAYAAAGLGVSAYGIWSAERLPSITRRTLLFPDLPPGLDGIRIAHLSDVHAGIHMSEEKMRAIVAQTNALGADLIVQTGDMIDISPSFIPDYVRAFRDLHASLGVVTVLGNHDRYTGQDAVIDPQDADLDAALRLTPPATDAFRILLAHRPGAFDGAAPRAIPLTLAGHIHGGQFYLPVVGWSPGRLITKYVMGHFTQGSSQLYVSRGIGVVGVPLRVFVPPEIALFELRRG